MSEAADNLWTVAYSPDGRTFATGGADRLIRVYDTATGKLLNKLEGHKGAVTALVADRELTREAGADPLSGLPWAP